MNTRIYNARILTMADGSRLTDGEVWVEGSRISYVGPEKQAAIQWDRQIDARGNLVMPGFKNAHTHSGMTFLRSYADDLPLQEWLNNKIFPMEATLNGEEVGLFSKLAIMEYLTSGITACFDMYLYPEDMAKASVECGFRTVLCDAVNNFVRSLEVMEADYQRFNSYHELISFQLGFHAEYTATRALLEGVADLSHRYCAPVYCHNSETRREVEECIERNETTPTGYFNQLGLYDYGGGGFHCVFMNEKDLQIFAEKKLSVVTNPAANCKLASGIAPLQQMREHQINLALGTDGPAGNNALDFFREMYLAAALQKVASGDAAAMEAYAVLEMATVGSARAMGLYECDTLSCGKRADLILLDLHQPNMQPMHNIIGNIVYSGSKQNVKMTMVNGRILYEDGRFDIGVEPEALYREIDRLVRAKITR